MTTTTTDDARILLKATKAKLVVVSSRIQSAPGKPIRKALDDRLPYTEANLIYKKSQSKKSKETEGSPR